jgi:hypothetical protein
LAEKFGAEMVSGIGAGWLGIFPGIGGACHEDRSDEEAISLWKVEG